MFLIYIFYKLAVLKLNLGELPDEDPCLLRLENNWGPMILKISFAAFP